MKHASIIACSVICSVSVYYPVNAQEYTDKTEALTIEQGTHIEESYVSRVTASDSRYSVYVDLGSSYTAKNINVTNNYDLSGSAIYALAPTSVSISADEGTWNTITVNGNCYGIYIHQSTGTSHISNTKIDMKGNSGYGIYTNGNTTVLDNIDIHLSSPSAGGNMGGAFFAYQGATITNKDKRQLTITSDDSGSATTTIWAQENSTVDLYNATINIHKTQETSSVLYAFTNSAISLTDSTISSGNGDTLIRAYSGYATFNLDRVNLTNAKNQQIANMSTAAVSTVNLSNGTNFDGYATAAGGALDISILSGASWNVTQDSILLSGTLTLGASSLISFVNDNGDFTSINAATVMLASGSILRLDRDAASLTEGSYAALFTASTLFDDQGAIVISNDGYIMELDTALSGNGTYYLTGQTLGLIPEPATASLTLTALGLLTLRRKKTAA